MRTQQPTIPVINGRDRTPADHGPPQQAVNLLRSMDRGKSNSHPPTKISTPAAISQQSVIYNTVILGRSANATLRQTHVFRAVRPPRSTGRRSDARPAALLLAR